MANSIKTSDEQSEEMLLSLARIRRGPYECLRNFAGTGLVLFLAVCVSEVLSVESGLLVIPVMFVGMGSVCWVGYRWTSARCPRCENTFFIKGYFGNAFGRKCRHCGLRLKPKVKP